MSEQHAMCLTLLSVLVACASTAESTKNEYNEASMTLTNDTVSPPFLSNGSRQTWHSVTEQIYDVYEVDCNGSTSETVTVNTVLMAESSTTPSPASQPDLLTAEQYSLAMQILRMGRYVILPLATMATCVNVVVFADRSMRGATSTYVLALSLAQILYLLIDVLFQILQQVMSFGNIFFIVYTIYIKTYLAMMVLNRTAYVVTCLVSVERLYAIVRPLHVKTFCLVRYPKTFIAASYIFGFVYNLFYTVRLKIVSTGEGEYSVQWLEGYLENRELVDGIGLSCKFVMMFIPMVVQIVLNVLTITMLKRHSATRKSMTATSVSDSGRTGVKSDSDLKSESDLTAERQLKRERQLTITILGVTICYVVLAMPITIHSVLISLNVPGYNSLFGARYRRLFYVFQDFSHTCTYLSCFTDFFGFLLLSSAYRKVLVSKFHLTHLAGRFKAEYQQKGFNGKTEDTDSTALAE